MSFIPIRRYLIIIDKKLTNQSTLADLEVIIKIFEGTEKTMSS